MSNQKIGFHHLAVRVKDYEVSKRFYTEALGAECYAEWHHPKGFMACMLQMSGGGVIEMLGDGAEALPANFECLSGCYIHLALRVEDVKRAFETALANGATAKGEIKTNETPSKMEIGTVYGPSGEIIEFLKPLL